HEIADETVPPLGGSFRGTRTLQVGQTYRAHFIIHDDSCHGPLQSVGGVSPPCCVSSDCCASTPNYCDGWPAPPDAQCMVTTAYYPGDGTVVVEFRSSTPGNARLAFTSPVHTLDNLLPFDVTFQ